MRSLYAIAAAFALVSTCASAGLRNTSIEPGKPWLDDRGEHINAHGFCILEHEGKYYWYGSFKIPGKTESQKNEAGVSCYTSTDLINWKNLGLVLSVRSPGMHPDVSNAGILDRPKVIFNKTTKRFVMYFKLYPPEAAEDTKGTDVAYTGVADSVDPVGPFQYRGKFLGADSPKGSGDFGIYQEGESIYHVCVHKPEKTLRIGRMSADGLKPEGKCEPLKGVPRATEAPVLFRHEGEYFLLGSGSTGWNPNPARMFKADKLTGPFRSLGNPCKGVNPHNEHGPDKAFGGQSTFVFPSPSAPGEWIAMFDVWKPNRPEHSGYIWLPLRFENGKPSIEWQTKWVP